MGMRTGWLVLKGKKKPKNCFSSNVISVSMERRIKTKQTFAECFVVRNRWTVEGNARGFCSDLEPLSDGRRVRRLHFTFQDSKSGFNFTAVYQPDCCSDLLKRRPLSAFMSGYCKADCWLELDREMYFMSWRKRRACRIVRVDLNLNIQTHTVCPLPMW